MIRIIDRLSLRYIQGKGKLIVVPDSMTISDIAKLYQATKEEMAVLKLKSSGDNNILDKASSIIRESIKYMEVPCQWPHHHPMETKKELIAVPAELKRFLEVLLTGKIQQECYVSESRYADEVIRPGSDLCCDRWTP